MSQSRVHYIFTLKCKLAVVTCKHVVVTCIYISAKLVNMNIVKLLQCCKYDVLICTIPIEHRIFFSFPNHQKNSTKAQIIAPGRWDNKSNVLVNQKKIFTTS